MYSEGARNGDAARPFGNPEVLQERAWQATLGAEVRPLPGFFISAETFYKGLSDLEYPFRDRTITVSNCGRICIGRCKINLSTVFAGWKVQQMNAVNPPLRSC